MTQVQCPQWLQDMQFAISAAKPKQFPEDEMLEIAFVGRSNVGKSSVLNALTARRQLARTSKTPGRTQLINFFQNAFCRLVDLPGYGFAKVSQAQRKQWDQLISDYLESRQQLSGLVLIMDARHPLKDIDLTLIEWVVQAGVPLLIILNKADKLSKKEQQQALNSVKRYCATMAEGIHCLLFSATKKTNMSALYRFLADWLQLGEAEDSTMGGDALID